MIRNVLKGPTSEKPIIVLEHDVSYSDAAVRLTLSCGSGATVDVKSIWQTRFGTLRKKLKQIWFVRKISAVPCLHCSYEFVTADTASPGIGNKFVQLRPVLAALEFDVIIKAVLKRLPLLSWDFREWIAIGSEAS